LQTWSKSVICRRDNFAPDLLRPAIRFCDAHGDVTSFSRASKYFSFFQSVFAAKGVICSIGLEEPLKICYEKAILAGNDLSTEAHKKEDEKMK
jgi:hypothetical protein